jgi:hypothetical protein
MLETPEELLKSIAVYKRYEGLKNLILQDFIAEDLSNTYLKLLELLADEDNISIVFEILDKLLHTHTHMVNDELVKSLINYLQGVESPIIRYQVIRVLGNFESDLLEKFFFDVLEDPREDIDVKEITKLSLAKYFNKTDLNSEKTVNKTTIKKQTNGKK